MKLIRKRLTYANVMASIAVFLVLGGGAAFAAAKLGKNSVGTKQLKNNAVTTKKIKNDAVTGAKVKESSLGEVPNAANAVNAQTASVGSPAAYAQIEAGGGIVNSEPSRGITDANVTEVEPGVYCVDLAFAAKSGSGNAESEGGEDGIVSLQLGAPYNSCPDSAEAEVRIYDAGEEEEDEFENIWVQFDS